jgi:hypothetical protein
VVVRRENTEYGDCPANAGSGGVEFLLEPVPAGTGHFAEEAIMIRRGMKFAFGALVALVFVLGITAFATPTHALIGHCICPDYIDPVKCSNGITYQNSCRASCAHATGCVRTGDI